MRWHMGSEWTAMSDEQAVRYAREVARRAAAELVEVTRAEYAGRPVRRAFFERDGRRFALVPGGDTEVGFDPERFEPTEAQRASYEQSADEYGLPGDLREYLASVTSPRRAARVPATLVAVEPVVFTGRGPEEVPALLAETGTRLLTPDEWEYACGAGTGTLFRWGDDCPAGRLPGEAGGAGGTDGSDRGGEPGAGSPFGLSIARDPYDLELTSDPRVLCGGDGGEAICGGYGDFLAWLPLAVAYRYPGLTDMLDEPDLYFDRLDARPAIDVE
ncbi:hypothetical protein GCM10023085_13880 [Actinomadura viridis]|uniref:Formylglycine-generating enzyme required for sulfatase activity n=1 Tax=Actinomadura viridis TaxID=58110 RepID=A0A931DTU3_9ACTN|nr:hypothetical protein [Actinomadura viridis]MBG6093761.1 formylglycine-generating enzyme required for sulfatase activity [Actinomadura viridis]